LVIVLWARTRPGYDPYGWIVWGYQTLHLSLNLGGAPSWKPLTFLFTVPYALFGHYALWLWMLTAVAISLAGCVFAGRIAYRLTSAGGEHRYAAIAAGVFAGVALLGIDQFAHDILSAQSDPMIVGICLAAIDCHLSRRPRWAFALGVLASLGRPEVWPFVGLYAIWAWRRIPSMRWMICAGLPLIPLLWFGVPTITNGRPLLAGELAQASPRELHGNKIIGTLHRFIALQYLPIQLAALFAVIVAWRRRDRTTLALAGCVLLWMVVEVAFALHGWPAVPRYMFEPVGVVCVLAGVGVGFILNEVPRLARVPRWAGIPVVAILVATLVPGAVARVRAEHTDLLHERARTTEIGKLHATVVGLGGAQKLRACGHPVVDVEYVSVLSWYLRLNTGLVGYIPRVELAKGYPVVLFLPLHNGWAVTPYHVTAADRAACTGVTAMFVPTARHPGGVVIHRRLS
jgi:hypothetical protein